MKQVKKEVKKDKKSTHKPNFYLTIINFLKQGLNPTKICHELGLTKQNLAYYTKNLKTIKAIEKVGYGTWNVSPYANQQVKKFLTKSTQYAKKKVNLFDSIKLSPMRFVQLLKEKGLHKCAVCNIPLVEIHHLKPIKKGGSNELFNMLPLCPNHHKEFHKSKTAFFDMKTKEFFNNFDKITLENRIRGHGFQFTFKIKTIEGWNKENRIRLYNKKGINFKELNIFGGAERIILKNKKIWLTSKSIVIFDKESLIEDTAQESLNQEINKILDIIEEVEKLFNVSFKINRQYQFKVTKQHFSRMKDGLAKEFLRNGEKLYVYNKTGLWFIIDNSYNLEEAETVHPKTAQADMDDAIVPFFNGLKVMRGFTPQFVTNSLGKTNQQINQLAEQVGNTTSNINQYAKELQTHVEAIRKLGTEVERLGNKIDEFAKKVVEKA